MQRCDGSDVEKRTFFAAVIQKWLSDGVPLWYCVQTPGTAVYSPSSVRGAGHVVFTLGPNILQTAWNAGVSLAAFRECLSTCVRFLPSCLSVFSYFLRIVAGHHSECPPVSKNSGDATRFIVPCLRMQALGLSIGLDEVGLALSCMHARCTLR